MRNPSNAPTWILAIIFLTLVLAPLGAQPTVEVSGPELSLNKGKVLIQYDLVNTKRSEKFTIRIEVTLTTGEHLNATSLSGDIGEGVPGGANRKIVWDIEADSVFLDEEIFVEVFALPEAPPVIEEPVAVVPPPVEEEKKEEVKEEPVVDQAREPFEEDKKEPVSEETIEPVAEKTKESVAEKTKESVAEKTKEPVAEKTKESVAEKTKEPVAEESKDTTRLITDETPGEKPGEPAKDSLDTGTESSDAGTEFSRAGLILQSVALPGLGLSRYRQKPHWIRGVLGYGCLGGSVALSYIAYDSYTAYQTADNEADMEDFFSKAQSRKSTSEILAYTAIGIWVADLVWTFIGTSDLSKKQTAGDLKGFSIGTTVEPVSSVPLIALRYRF